MMDPHRLSLSGSLTFLSSNKLEDLKRQFKKIDASRGVIVDLSDVESVDATGAEQLVDFVEELKEQGAKVALLGASLQCQKQLNQSDVRNSLSTSFAATESDIRDVLQSEIELQAIHRLKHGVESYRNRKERYYALFERLATGQKPHTLFITCSDSRIDPSLITSTSPGELLIVRNVGNIVPLKSAATGLSEAAAIEFAVKKLEVSEIVVCGHSGCGAIQAALSPETHRTLPDVALWLERSAQCFKSLEKCGNPDEIARANVLHQLQHLKSYPSIEEKLKDGTLRLHGWFYDISKSDIEELVSFSNEQPGAEEVHKMTEHTSPLLVMN